MLRPSCPVLVIHDDDAFRKSLIATLDREHFTVTMAIDGAAAVDILRNRKFRVVVLGVNLKTRNGAASLDYLRGAKADIGCAVLIVGDADPNIRTHAPWADETLMKPVDASYVAARARSYCS